MKDFNTGVWHDYVLGMVFVSLDYPKPTPYTFAFSQNDHTENTTLIKNCRKYRRLENFY